MLVFLSMLALLIIIAILARGVGRLLEVAQMIALGASNRRAGRCG
jgi:hypothetical protein